MRRSHQCLALVLCAFWLAGCGGEIAQETPPASTELPPTTGGGAPPLIGQDRVSPPPRTDAPAISFPFAVEQINANQTKEWVVGRWTVDYEAPLTHAADDKIRTEIEKLQRERVTSMEVRADGTATLTDQMSPSQPEFKIEGTWTCPNPWTFELVSESGKKTPFSLQPNGFLLNTFPINNGPKEDYWKKIR